MNLKENTFYWEESLKVPEKEFDPYYMFDNIIVNSTLRQQTEELRDLIRRYCNPNNEDKLKLIQDIITKIKTVNNIQYNEFVEYWKTKDLTFSAFKTMNEDDKFRNVKFILDEYCKNRFAQYSTWGYTDVIIQALYDSGASRSKGNAGISKLLDLFKIKFDPVHITTVSDFSAFDVCYLSPDKRDNKLFENLLNNHLKIELPYRQAYQNKRPDLMLKCNNKIFFVEAKHIKEIGGAQNSSITELINFIKQEVPANNYIYYFISFLDGTYFNLFIDSKISNPKLFKQKKDIINTLQNYPKSFMVNTNGITKLFDDIY